MSAGHRTLIGLAFLWAGVASAQTPALGPEFPVNTYTTGDQIADSFGNVGMDSSGNFVIVWKSYGEDGSNDGVFGRRFDHSGVPLGAEFQVNTFTTGPQRQPAVAVDPAGDFVVVWSSYDQLGTGQTDVFGQRYDAAGVAQGGEFHVNTYSSKARRPSIGMDSSGNFVVSWQSDDEDGSGRGIFAQRFNSAGARLGTEFQVNTYTTGDQEVPIVGLNGTGDFVIAWTSPSEDGSGLGVFAQRYDSAGTPQGGEFQVNTYTTGDQAVSGVGLDSAGNFVVVWTSLGQDGSGYGAFGKRYDSTGAAQGGEFPINTYTTGGQGAPVVAMNASGEFVVTWISDGQDGSAYGIVGQRFDASGRRVGTEFQVNTYTTGVQGTPAVSMDDSGNFAVVWTSEGQDGSGAGVFAKRGEFNAAQPMKVDVHSGVGSSSNMNGVLEPGESVQLEPGWMDTVAIPLTFTGAASNLSGPPGPTYTIDDNSADYGTVTPGSITNCYDATGAHDCYVVTVSGARPAPHWDAIFDETLSTGFTPGSGLAKRWTLHVGDSFADVPTTQQFYGFIENLFHNGITGGCGGGNYCPGNSVTRAQMAVFLLKAKHGTSYVPPACAGIFGDVPCPSQFADWIEELSAEGITGGCGGGDYCPNDPVTRAQMAVFLLKAEHGSTYVPPACMGIFPDVTCPSLFANWVEQLFNEGITGGCGGGDYCPDDPNTRGQMAVFLVKTFHLLLYGP